MVTGHGNIKSYLYKYKILDCPMFPYNLGEQTTDHILYDFDLVKQERNKIKAEILRRENLPVSKYILVNKYTKIFNKFVDSIQLENS